MKDPIILIGAGRSGSTLLQNLLARHEKTAWLSTICNKHPRNPVYNKIRLRLVDFCFFSECLKKRWKPREGYKYWNYFYKGFSRPCRDLFDYDLNETVANRIKESMRQMLNKKRDQFVLKVTGWPRIGFLKKIFDNAKFVHVVRDGRAVAHSLTNVDWWYGWKGPSNWRWGELDEQYNSIWLNNKKDFNILAAIQWRIILDAVHATRDKVKSKDFYEVRYEDLCSQPSATIGSLLDFCGLEYTDKYKRYIVNYNIKSANTKWKSFYSNEQIAMINKVIFDYLEKYNYEV